MIPKFNADIRREIDWDKLEWPPEEILAEEDGLLANNNYFDYRGWFDWKTFARAYHLESKIISRVDRQSRSRKSFEDKLLEWENLDRLQNTDLGDFDIGVSSSTIAIYALGAISVSSCRGKGSWRRGDHPYIALWAKRPEAETILAVAEGLGIGCVSCGFYDREDGILVYSKDTLDMMKFGKALYDRRDK